MAVPFGDPGYLGGGGSTSATHSSALRRWLDQQNEARTQFGAATKPLQESVAMFQPGGGYGRGQELLLRDEARRSKAEATTQQVASGMSSGSLATGTKLRVDRDLATGLAGVEDVRTQFLNQALQMLSNLLGTQAQTTAGTVDPTYAPYMGAQSASNVAGAQGAAGLARTVAARPPTPSIFGQPRASTLKEQARYSFAPSATTASFQR